MGLSVGVPGGDSWCGCVGRSIWGDIVVGWLVDAGEFGGGFGGGFGAG